MRTNANHPSLLWVVMLMFAMSFVPAARAGSLDSSVIGMFPKNTESFAYADLAEARKSSWFPQLEAQLLPVPLHNFEQFVESSAFGLDSHIDQVVWGTIAIENDSGKTALLQKKVAGVLIGHFDSDSAKLSLKTLNIPVLNRDGHTLYASGSGSGSEDVYFTFVDKNEIAFGPRDALEALNRTIDGSDENLLENSSMFTLINQANGSGIFWGVLDGPAAGAAVQQLVPEAARFPQSAQLIQKFRALIFTVADAAEIQATLQLITPAPEDAIILSQLVQAGVMMRRYQASSSRPGLASVLDTAQISASGNQLLTSFQLTSDQLLSLIEQNTFIPGM